MQVSTKSFRSRSNYSRDFCLLINQASDNDEPIEGKDGVDVDGDDTVARYKNVDVQLENEDDLYEDDTVEDWIPDADRGNQQHGGNHELIPAKEVLGESYTGNSDKETSQRPSPYTDDEEEIIAAMGGKNKKNKKGTPRENGFLGDSTLREIASDYSVPICYLADVLVQWGVDVPINVHDLLGDLVTGEQAFALVESVNTLDVGYLNDRYSNQNLQQVCYEWEIELKDAFEFAMKEGWSLPFGVRTNLRVEQEDELLRVFSLLYRDVDDD